MDRLQRNLAIVSSGVALAGGGAVVGHEIGQSAAEPFDDQANIYQTCADRVTPHTRILEMPRLCPRLVKLDYINHPRPNGKTTRATEARFVTRRVVSTSEHPVEIAHTARNAADKQSAQAKDIRRDGTIGGLKIAGDIMLIGLASAALVRMKRRAFKTTQI